jgi:ABC-type amino acid transport substrate-binding protein
LSVCLGLASNASRAQDTIVFGTDPTYRPLAFMDESNKLVGFDVDLAHAMAERMGAKAKIETMSFDGLIPALQSKRIDVEPEMAIRPQRKEQVDFSVPFFSQTNTVVMAIDRTDFNPSSPDELKGQRIGLAVGTGSDILLGKIPGLDITRYNTVPDAFRDLVLKRIDLVAVDSLTAGYQVKHTFPKQLRVSKSSLTGKIEIGSAVRKGNVELVERLNKAIEKMKADGSLDSIIKKWFGDIAY